jgi:prostatic aicd phosphatase
MMHLLSLILLFVRVGGQGSGNLPNRSLIRDPNTKLVIFGTRHGNRNPGVFLDSQPQRQWGLEGANELNQAYY